MDGIEHRISSILRERDTLRERTDALREGWAGIERDVFSLLDQASIKPQFLAYQRTPDANPDYVRIDWINRKLIEIDIKEFIVHAAAVDRFGNAVGGEEAKNTGEEFENVTGIASSF